MTPDASISQQGQGHQRPPFKLRLFVVFASAEAIHTTMASTAISARPEREAREANASRASGGQDEDDARSVEEGSGWSDEEVPFWKQEREGSSDSEEDGGEEKRSEGGDGGRGSGGGQDEGGVGDIKMNDRDGGGEGRATEGGRARALSDVVTPRNSKRAAPEIELSKAVSKKQKNAVMGGLPRFSEELVACVQVYVDAEEAGDSLREAISGHVNAQNLPHKLLHTKSGTEEKLAKNGGQVAIPSTVNHELLTLINQSEPLLPHPQPPTPKPSRQDLTSCDTQDSHAD